MRQVVRRTVVRRLRRVVLWNGNVEPPLRTIITEQDHIVRWAWRTRPAPSTFLPVADARGAGGVDDREVRAVPDPVVRDLRQRPHGDVVPGGLRRVRAPRTPHPGPAGRRRLAPPPALRGRSDSPGSRRRDRDGQVRRGGRRDPCRRRRRHDVAGHRLPVPARRARRRRAGRSPPPAPATTVDAAVGAAIPDPERACSRRGSAADDGDQATTVALLLGTLQPPDTASARSPPSQPSPPDNWSEPSRVHRVRAPGTARWSWP